MAQKIWLMKSEPSVYSISHLQKDKSTPWEGVRNYQARNYMMNEMQVGDLVLFYHSNAEPSGLAGLAEVSAKAAPDRTQFNKKSEQFDAKATAEKPIWYCVEVRFVRAFKGVISLEALRAEPKLKDMMVLRKGSRLSVQPVTSDEYKEILKLEKKLAL